MTSTENKQDFELADATSYIALTDELWSVYCESLGEIWPRYNGIAMYLALLQYIVHSLCCMKGRSGQLAPFGT